MTALHSIRRRCTPLTATALIDSAVTLRRKAGAAAKSWYCVGYACRAERAGGFEPAGVQVPAIDRDLSDPKHPPNPHTHTHRLPAGKSGKAVRAHAVPAASRQAADNTPLSPPLSPPLPPLPHQVLPAAYYDADRPMDGWVLPLENLVSGLREYYALRKLSKSALLSVRNTKGQNGRHRMHRPAIPIAAG